MAMQSYMNISQSSKMTRIISFSRSVRIATLDSHVYYDVGSDHDYIRDKMLVDIAIEK